jgi:ketopantoate reductase
VICHWGNKNGVKTPINNRIVQIVKDLQSGKLRPKAENINLFPDLLQ